MTKRLFLKHFLKSSSSAFTSLIWQKTTYATKYHSTQNQNHQNPSQIITQHSLTLSSYTSYTKCTLSPNNIFPYPYTHTKVHTLLSKYTHTTHKIHLNTHKAPHHIPYTSYISYTLTPITSTTTIFANSYPCHPRHTPNTLQPHFSTLPPHAQPCHIMPCHPKHTLSTLLHMPTDTFQLQYNIIPRKNRLK